MIDKYPWLKSTWNDIERVLSSKKVPHAWHLPIHEGLAASALYRHLAQALLCQMDVGPKPCGVCRSCQLSSHGHHPDYYECTTDQRTLSVDDIRYHCSHLQETASVSSKKILVFPKSNQITPHGFNALLKTLEEPPDNSFILIVADPTVTLPITIKSRLFPLPAIRASQKDAYQYLQQQGVTADRIPVVMRQSFHQPLTALALFSSKMDFPLFKLQLDRVTTRDILKVAADLKAWSPAELHTACIMLIYDFIQCHFGLTERLFYLDEIETITVMSQWHGLNDLYEWLDQLYQLKTEAHLMQALNQTLLFEQFLFKLYRGRIDHGRRNH